MFSPTLIPSRSNSNRLRRSSVRFAFFCIHAAAFLQSNSAVVAAKELYDDIAEDYAAIKTNVFKVTVEEPTYLNMVGDLDGKTVLDLACGAGHYTKLMIDGRTTTTTSSSSDDTNNETTIPNSRPPQHVTCVDISDYMIQMAQAAAQNDPALSKLATYVVGSAADYIAPTPVHVVTAQYLVNYATTREELDAFSRTAFVNLQDGGKFVSMAAYYRVLQQGEGWYVQTRAESAPATVGLLSADKSSKVSLPVTVWSLEAMEESLRAAGFVMVRSVTMGEVPIAIVTAVKGIAKVEL